MTRTLVVAEVVDGAVSPLTAEAVSAAASLGGDVVLAVVAAEAGALAAQVALAGVTEVVTVTAPGTDRDHEQMLHAVEALVADVAPQVVIAGFTIRSTAWAAALAQRLDLAFVPDVVSLTAAGAEITAEITAERSIYDGRVRAEYAFPSDRPLVALVRGASWPPAEPAAAPATRALDVDLPPSRVRAGELTRPSGDVDLTGSDVIFAIGRGVGSEDNIAAFADIARRLGAGLGASRPIIDAGWLPAVHQVGQTGVTVKPKVYVALGISGALHHLAGMQNSKTIVAVNTNEDAPIFGYADVGAVADIHEVAEQLQALL
jgi:electron transfer flavoprotein alpha subunit